MNTLITQPFNGMRNLGARYLTALLTLCCAFGVLPAFAASWTVGTGTSQWTWNAAAPAPLGYFQHMARGQYMWKASELTAAGIPANTPISQIAFNVGSLQNLGATLSGAPNFTMGIQPTSLANLNSGSFINNGFTPCSMSTGDNRAGLGWNIFTLATPFTWNGTDNIVVDFCYYTGFSSASTTSIGYGNAGVFYNTTVPSGGPYSIYYTLGNGATSICGGIAPTVTTTTWRPNIRFSSNLPCTSLPASAIGNLNYPATVSGICPGTSITLQDTNYATNVGITYQWETATASTGPWTAIGGNQDRLHTPPLTSSVYYRLNMTCNFGGSGATTPVYFPVTTPVTYATVPFTESFENWGDGCSTGDKPGAMWTNIPSTGNSSRRRQDQGSTASWVGNGAATTSKDGANHSRFNGYQYNNNTIQTQLNPGNEFSLHLDCSSTTGVKELRFWYQFKNSVALGNLDSLIVELSTNGGYTFAPITGGQLNSYFGTISQWNYLALPVNSNSARTIIRFRSRALSSYQSAADILLDKIDVVPPCNAKPVAGRIDSATACVNTNVTLYSSGTSMAAGLTYLWQSRPSGSTLPWSAMPGGTGPTVTTTVTSTNQDIRLIVGCSNTTPPLYDTTAIYTLKPAPFYYCYCSNITASYTTSSSYFELGNTTLVKESNKDTLLNNGIATPLFGNPNATFKPYENFTTTVKPADVVLDSSYRLWLTQTAGYNYWYTTTLGAAWIDYDQSGTYDAGEKIMNDKSIASQANPTVNQLFRIPVTAKVGLTGLRTCLNYAYTPITPCQTNQSYYGQYEDYLVRINYQPCTGPASAGLTEQSDTAVCPGYTVNLWNTTYQQDRTGINRMWERSTNNGASFQAIPNGGDKDSMINLVVTQATVSKYRLRLICSHTNDTTYSNVVTVTTPVPYRCYPTNWASFGPQDSSDIGSVVIGNRTFPATGPGPHLMNPQATKRRTDWTLEPPIILHADSTYRIGVFHTMPRAWHKDALVSVFFDYNNDGDYDVSVPGGPFTSELAMQGISVHDSFFLDTKIKIPSAVIPDVPTGMRVVLNNDLNPGAAANMGAGAFTSGEVEDFVVIFRRVNLGVNPNSALAQVALYPNPTDGRFTVLNDAPRAVSHMDIVVTTVSGQEVVRRSFDNVGTHFTTSLDLSAQAKGIYFVEIRADGEKVTRKLVVR